MSEIQRATETYPCSAPDCDDLAQPHEMVDGSYCSLRCSRRHDGDKLLRNIEHDHRFCTTCFRQLKEIEKPDATTSVVVGPVDHDEVADTTRDCLIGMQYRTRHAETGEIEGRPHVEVHTDAPGQDRPLSPGDRLAMTGTVCKCGTTDHRDDYLRGEHVTDVRDAAERLCGILDWLGREGQDDRTVHAATLIQTLTETLREDGEPDWALAVGRAVA